MGHPILRLFDGLDNTSPELREDVRALQTLLNQDGASLTVDGILGRDTESAVRRFQNEHGLADDGIVGPLTWSALMGTPSPDTTKTFLTTLPVDDHSLTAQLAKATEFKAFIESDCVQKDFRLL
jgi:peptidoglycan hydrolase-like protein with peptidoglycan-binding domain